MFRSEARQAETVMAIQEAHAVKVIEAGVSTWITNKKALAERVVTNWRTIIEGALTLAPPGPAKSLLGDVLRRRPKPRVTAHMTPDTVANWQQVIANRRKTRARPSDPWAMRREIQARRHRAFSLPSARFFH